MSLLARSFAALAISALAAGVVTVGPAGVAAASSGGGIYGGTTNQQSGPFDRPVDPPGLVVGIAPVDTTGVETQPTSQTVRKPKRTTRGAAARAGGAVGNNMPLGAIPVKTGSVGTAIVPQG